MTSPATDQHRAAAHNQRARCAVLTVSDTRTADTDDAGRYLREQLEAAGHTVAAHAIVRDEPTDIGRQLRAWLPGPSPVGNPASAIQAIFTTGGTGIARRDTTVEVVEQLLDKPLPGFGELFRMLSYEQVGPAAMLSRATAGLAGNTLVFALPGSLAAVELAVTKLILPELPHLVWERGR